MRPLARFASCANGGGDMMGDFYNPKKSDLPDDVLRAVMGLVSGYDRKKAEAADALTTAIPMDGTPRGTTPGDPTAHAAIVRENNLADIRAVDAALLSVPEDMRRPIWEVVTKGRKYDTISAARGTITKYRYRFLYMVAYWKGWI